MTDQARNPIVGAVVQILPQFSEIYFPDFWVPTAEVQTDEQGRFRLDLVETSRTVLLAHAKGFRRTRFALTPDALRNSQVVGLALERGEAIGGTVVDEIGKPIAGVDVGPLVGSIDMETAFARRHVPQWTQTDQQGRFEFDGVMPKQPFQFLVRKAGYEIQNVTAQAGQRDLVIRLRRGGSAIRGVVRSRSAEPNQYAGQLLRFNGNGFDLLVKADADGRFTVEGLPPGNFSLEAIATPPRISKVLTLEFPRDAGREFTVELSEGYFFEGITYDAETSTPATGVGLRIEDCVTTSDAAGRFRIGPLWLTGKPWIEIDESSGFAPAAPPPGGLVRSDEADGFRNLLEQTVWVRRLTLLRTTVVGLSSTTRTVTAFYVPRHGVLHTAAIVTSPLVMRVRDAGDAWLYASDGYEWASQLRKLRIAPTAKQVHTTLTIQQAAALGGAVKGTGNARGTTAPRVLARVYAEITPDGAGSGLLMETECDVDGSFRFPCLPSGDLVLEVTKVGTSIRRVQQMTLRPGEQREVHVELPAGKLFAGSVRDEMHSSLGGVNVLYYVRMSDGSTRAGTVETSPDGTFRVLEVEGDMVDLVRVEHPSFAPWEKRDISLPCDNLEIVLKQRAALRYKVEAPPTSQWKVYLMRIQPWGSGPHAKQLQGTPIAEVQALGAQEDAMEGPPPGDYRLVAISSDGTLGVSNPFHWEHKSPPPMPIRILAGASGGLRGTLEGGEHVVAEVVSTNMVLPDGKCTTEYSTTAQDGRFSYDALPPGDYLVLVTSESFNASEENVRVEAGRVTEIRLQPLSLGSIRGTVTKDKQALEGADIELVSQTDPDFDLRKTTTSSDGSFVFADLPLDLYLVRAKWTDGEKLRSVQKSVRLSREEKDTHVMLDFTPPPRLAFTLPPQLAVITGQPVQMLNRETGELVRPEWKNGILEAELVPGLYNVSVGDLPLGDVRVSPDGTVELAE